ncbi:MAG: hypothetical protein JWQ71_2310 [Pedosphaera sp.]|nr:hypothetical protein [Pedosphaera sp.]
MRSLAQSQVLTKAAAAALITSLAAYPRLATWMERTHAVAFMVLMLMWTTFVLWAFVFAWHEQYSKRPVLNFSVQPKWWALATALGLFSSLLLLYVVDPQMRLITPKEYPETLSAWVSMALFALAFEPLFLCFAPFAFFIRLFRKPQAAIVLTVLFGVFLLYLKLSSSEKLPPTGFIAGFALMRVAAGFMSLYVYLQGGALLVWWMVILMQLRHLIHLPGSS